MDLIVPLSDVGASDVASVGAKAANLGELITAQFTVPPGFVITADAYECIRGDSMPEQLLSRLALSYARLGRRAGELDPVVAVRSSVIGEDASGVNFAGVYASVTGVRGVTGVGRAVERCWTSLRSARAAAYAELFGVDQPELMAVIIQLLVPAVCGGVAFGVDPTGRHRDAVIVEASYGPIQSVVGGLVEPDAYVASRRTAHLTGFHLGTKSVEVSPCGKENGVLPVEQARRWRRALEPDRASAVARLAVSIEERIGAGGQEIEWCYDAGGRLFVVQTKSIPNVMTPRTRRRGTGAVMATGAGASPGLGTGPARLLEAPDEIDRFHAGDVLVVPTGGPEWLPALVRAAGVVSDRGGITGHLAVACRALGLPCVVGTRTATVTARDGDVITVDGTAGAVRAGRIGPIRGARHATTRYPAHAS
jgi:pyruvate,water dikinase